MWYYTGMIPQILERNKEYKTFNLSFQIVFFNGVFITENFRIKIHHNTHYIKCEAVPSIVLVERLKKSN